jgi:tripartite-type tricarboxylate transporter receptor subunit TctC
MTLLRFSRAAAAVLMLGPFAMLQGRPQAQAQSFPSKAVTIVVPFTPGGAGDILSRMIAQKLEPIWGKPIVVENKPGAGGLIGANALLKAAPDGHTLMIAPSAIMAVNVTLHKNLPYDPTTDLVPLALAAQTPFVLVVNPSVPARDVAELLAYVKSKDGNISYATAGAGTPHHLFAELLKTMTGINMSPVAYRGSMPSVTDVVAGHMPLMFVDLGPSLGLIRSGKLRALGVSTKTRLESLPDVPPIADTVPGFDAASWQMLVTLAKTPRPVIDKLHADLKAVLALPEIQEGITQRGMGLMQSPSVEALQAFVKSEIERWGKAVRQAGIAGSQ